MGEWLAPRWERFWVGKPNFMVQGPWGVSCGPLDAVLAGVLNALSISAGHPIKINVVIAATSLATGLRLTTPLVHMEARSFSLRFRYALYPKAAGPQEQCERRERTQVGDSCMFVHEIPSRAKASRLWHIRVH